MPSLSGGGCGGRRRMSIDRFSVLRVSWRKASPDAAALSSEDIERRQAKLWRKFTPVIAQTPALAHLAGSSLERFQLCSRMKFEPGLGTGTRLGLL